MKEIIKIILKSNAVGKWIYPFVQECYCLFAIPIKRRRLQRYGGEVLHKIHDILGASNVDYYADWGTLLGIVRDKGFIRHDDDIDLTIVNVDIDPIKLLTLLLQNGFQFIHALTIKDRIVEFSVAWKRLSTDFFFRIPTAYQGKVGIADVYFDPKVEYENTKQNSYKIWLFPEDVSIKSMLFKGGYVNIPENPGSMLEYEYGADWMCPISGWTADKLEGRYELQNGYAVRITNVSEIIKTR